MAPRTRFLLLLCTPPATALTLYCPGRTRCVAPLQPGDEVRRSQETRSTAGALLVRTVSSDLAPVGQSAELQMRRPPRVVTTTATNLVPMLKRQDWPWLDAARTVNRGVLPV